MKANIYKKAKYSLDECPASNPCLTCIVGMTCAVKCIPKIKFDVKQCKLKKPVYKIKIKKKR